MTEVQWSEGADPEPMLTFLRGDLSKRKLRLFASACCRRIWHLLADERSRSAVGVAELHADGLADDRQLAAAESLAEEAFQAIPWEPNGMPSAAKLAVSVAWAVVTMNLEETVFGGEPVAGFAINTALQAGDATDDPKAERSGQADVLRDIFGSPFRPVAFDPGWRTAAVVQLARQMYESWDFSAAPVLADALQDAGCEDEQVLGHCRGPGPHVRGCWVVDLVLGKA